MGNYFNFQFLTLILISLLSTYLIDGADNNNLYSVSIGGLVLQLQSQADIDDPHEFLMEGLTKTVDFLDGAFHENYNVDDVFVNGYFSHIGMSVESFELNYSPLALENNGNANGNRKFFASVEFSGFAYFHALPTPSQDEISTQLFRTFQDGTSNQEFVSSLLDSHVPFLNKLVFAVVRVNGFVVASNPITITGAGGGNQLSRTGQAVNQNVSSSVTVQQIAMIVGATGGVLLLLILCYCCCWQKLCRKASKRDESKGQQNNNVAVQHTLTGVTSKSEEIDIESTHTPRSVRSFTSQESSLFTYNPASRISFDASTITSFNTDLQSAAEMDAWQRRNTITNTSRLAPFGHDISAIEEMSEAPVRKDLSLIEECDEEHNSSRDKSSSSRGMFLQRELRSDRNRSRDRSSNSRDRSSSNRDRSNSSRDRSGSSRDHSRDNRDRSSSSHSESNNTYRSLHRTLNSSHVSNDANNISDMGDIVEELNNLSLQINQHRGR